VQPCIMQHHRGHTRSPARTTACPSCPSLPWSAGGSRWQRHPPSGAHRAPWNRTTTYLGLIADNPLSLRPPLSRTVAGVLHRGRSGGGIIRSAAIFEQQGTGGRSGPRRPGRAPKLRAIAQSPDRPHRWSRPARILDLAPCYRRGRRPFIASLNGAPPAAGPTTRRMQEACAARDSG